MHDIEVTHLLYLLLPVSFVGYFYFRWVGKKFEILYASFRMLLQLLLVGYLLAYVFEAKTSYMTVFIVIVMISAASMITLRNITHKNVQTYKVFL